MGHQELMMKYLDRLVDVGTRSNDRLQQLSYVFVGATFVLYFITTSTNSQIELLGATIALPRSLALVTAPLVLAVNLYFISCFAAHEEQAYREMRRVIQQLAQEQVSFAPWQLMFFEAPSYYRYSALRDHSAPHRLFRWASAVVDWLLSVLFILVFPSVIGYFIFRGVHDIRAVWLAVPYSVSAFLALFASAQYFEQLSPRH